MKKIKILYLAASATLIISSCTRAPESDKAVTGEAKEPVENADGKSLKIDPSSSNIEWIGTKVSGYHIGNLKLEAGEISMEDGIITGGKITMDMKSIAVTGPDGSDEKANNKLMGHLLSDDFFSSEKFPEAGFEITGVKQFEGAERDTADVRQESLNKYKVTDPSHIVSGNLTIKDVTKNISFPAKITITDNSITAVAKFNIDRTQWNITYPGKPDDLIRNEIHFGISIKAYE
jgi:polyisoprenoid-binding protein YceI